MRGRFPAGRKDHSHGVQMQPGGGAAGNRPSKAGGPWEINLTAGLRSLLAQALTVFQRSLTTMQTQVAELLQFAVPVFPMAEVRLSPQHARRKRGSPRARASESQAVERVPSP